MELTVKDICELLNIKSSTLEKWIKTDKIPAYKINNQYKFNKSEIKSWVVEQGIKTSSKILDISTIRQPISLLSLMQKGGVHYHVEGSTVHEVIKNAIHVIPIPEDLHKDKIILTLLEREEMMSTSIGKGIAIPHPRNPIITDVENEQVALCFLKSTVDFKAIDREMTQTLFIVLSAKPDRHLEILSKISYLCHQPDFVSCLKAKISEEKIFSFIQEQEALWNKRTAG